MCSQQAMSAGPLHADQLSEKSGHCRLKVRADTMRGQAAARALGLKRANRVDLAASALCPVILSVVRWHNGGRTTWTNLKAARIEKCCL